VRFGDNQAAMKLRRAKPAALEADGEIVHLSEAEVRRMIDCESRAALGMSG
jgi:hypothetical protein